MAKKNNSKKAPYAWAFARISIGLIFLWAFFDKLIGLGFTTCRNVKTDAIDVLCDKAWLSGASPTEGFLKFGTKGPFADFYQNLSGITFIDWLFMLGLLLIGIALVSGVAVKIAAFTGSLLLFMMWTAVLPPEHHPFIDDHIVYIIVLMGISFSNNDQRWGLRSWWVSRKLVKQYPGLE